MPSSSPIASPRRLASAAHADSFASRSAIAASTWERR